MGHVCDHSWQLAPLRRRGEQRCPQSMLSICRGTVDWKERRVNETEEQDHGELPDESRRLCVVWNKMRGELNVVGKLVDDDFDRIGGQKDKLIGVVQEKYGAREKAQQEVERRFKEYGDKNERIRQQWAGAPRRRLPVGRPMRRTKVPIATTVAAVVMGWNYGAGFPRQRPPWRDGWNWRKARFPQRRPPWRMEWDRRAQYLQEKNSKRWQPTHRLDTPVPRPIVIGWRGPWLYPGFDFTPR